MEYKDYYKILGVSRSADQDEIKKAYRRLARKYHPDVSREKDAEARFKEVSEAYEVLKDPDRRATYDHLGTYRQGQDFRPPPGWRGGFSGSGGSDGSAFSDFFESVFGQGSPFGEGAFGGRRRRSAGYAAKGPDDKARIGIALEDAYQGASKNVRLDGAGGRQLKVKIPAGITEGRQIRLSGQGRPGPGGGPRGDLYLEIHITPHPLYRVEGRDLFLDLPIAPWEAALGGPVKVPTLGGSLELKIPPGSQTGRKLRLKGRGLPGSPPGDQYVVLKIVTPKAETKEARELYEKMSKTMAFDPRAELAR